MAVRTLSNSRLVEIFRQLDSLSATNRRYSKITEAYDRVCTELERRGIQLAALAG
jgi:hypothetical protein